MTSINKTVAGYVAHSSVVNSLQFISITYKVSLLDEMVKQYGV